MSHQGMLGGEGEDHVLRWFEVPFHSATRRGDNRVCGGISLIRSW